MPRPYIMFSASDLELAASDALGIGAASFASDFGNGIWGRGRGHWACRSAEVRFWEARRKHGEQRYSGKPDGDSRNAQISFQLLAISGQ